MKIIMTTTTLFDANSPFNHLLKDILKGLLSEKNEIVRLVAVPNDYDDGFKLDIKDRNIAYKCYKRKKDNHNNIFSRYISDMLTNIREAFGILSLKADVLFEDVTYSSFLSVVAAKIKGMRVVSMLQDIWPDNAVQIGLIRGNSFLYKLFELMQKFVYINSDKIICISEDMKEFMISKGVDGNKITVIYNWGYSDDIVSIGWKDNRFVKKYNLEEDKKYVIYAGNIGRMQNVEIVIRIAQRMLGESTIRFLIVGDGAKKDEIRKMAKKLSNVEMISFQSASMAEEIYSVAAINIITLIDDGLRTAMPSKTGVCLSCGNPILFIGDPLSKLSEMFEETSCGVVLPSDDIELIESYIKDITSKPNMKKYTCFKKYFNRSKNIRKYIETICGVEES